MRSPAFNRYYHKIVVVAVQRGLYEVGYDLSKEETHEELKQRFLKVEILDESTWTYKSETGSTRALTNQEFKRFIEQIQIWSSTFLNVYIPDPNEVL